MENEARYWKSGEFEIYIVKFTDIFKTLQVSNKLGITVSDLHKMKQVNELPEILHHRTFKHK